MVMQRADSEEATTAAPLAVEERTPCPPPSEASGDNQRRTFWTEYYQEVFAKPTAWLDHSNAATQSQTFGVILESTGPLVGRRCLDVGCGRGTFALALMAGGACEVVGIDIIADAIETLRKRHGQVRWEVGSPEDGEFCQSLGTFDLIFAIEVFQYVPMEKAIRLLWEQLRPGGRLVAVVPNKECPIVKKTIARFGDCYNAPTLADVKGIVSQLTAVECWGYRGMAFQQDQRLTPYAVSAWATDAVPASPPNRLVFAAIKQCDPATARRREECHD